MKSKLIVAIVMLFSVLLHAQYNVVDADGVLMEDGTVRTFGTIDETIATLEFFVNNETTDPINVKIEFVSATNADGSEIELCFGLCYTSIVVGSAYPLGQTNFVTIAGGGQTLAGNHFYNSSDGGGSPIEYEFRFYMVDVDGNDLGNSTMFTYRYDPALGLDENQLLEVAVTSTIVSDVLVLETQEQISVAIYDLQGRQLINQNLEVGSHTLDVAALPNQSYIVRFTNEDGLSKVTKFVKR